MRRYDQNCGERQELGPVVDRVEAVLLVRPGVSVTHHGIPDRVVDHASVADLPFAAERLELLASQRQHVGQKLLVVLMKKFDIGVLSSRACRHGNTTVCPASSMSRQ